MDLPYSSFREIVSTLPKYAIMLVRFGYLRRELLAWGKGYADTAVTRILVLGDCNTCIYNGLECSIRERVGG